MPNLEPIGDSTTTDANKRILAKRKLMTKAPIYMEAAMNYVDKYFDAGGDEDESNEDRGERRDRRKEAHALMHKFIDRIIPVETKQQTQNGPGISENFADLLRVLANGMDKSKDLAKVEAEYQVEGEEPSEH